MVEVGVACVAQSAFRYGVLWLELSTVACSTPIVLNVFNILPFVFCDARIWGGGMSKYPPLPRFSG